MEAALLQDPDVHEAAVVARLNRAGENQLVAFIVARRDDLKVGELRRRLRTQLPAHLIPSVFVPLASLPRRANGKLDRSSLPVDLRRRLEPAVLSAPPQTVDEQRLAGIWCEVLEVNRVGIHDNFFDLGGDSLMAVKLFDRVSRVTGQHLPLATLFECPTIEHLARVLRERNWSPTWMSLVPIQPAGSKPPLFLVPPAGGSVLRFAELARQLGPDQPVYGLEPLGHDDRHRPLDRVEDMAALYLKEIRELQPTGPYLFAGVCFGGIIAFEMARRLTEKGDHVALVALLDPSAPEHGPTWSTERDTIRFYAQRLMCHWANGRLLWRVMDSAFRRWKRIRSCLSASGRRYLRMLDAHHKAQVSYAGCPASTGVVLIQSEQNSKLRWIDQRWAELATGQFEHVVVPGTTHRDLLLGTEFTPALARILREHLDDFNAEPTVDAPITIPFSRPVPMVTRRAA